MFCNKCGASVQANTKFCPKCGAPVAAVQAPVDDINRTVVAEDISAYPPSQTPPVQPHTAPPAQPAQPYAAPQTPPVPPYAALPVQPAPPYGYNQGGNQPYTPAPEQKPSAGVRVLSVVLCLLIFLFTFLSVTIGVVRASVSENSIRSKADKGSISSIKVNDKNGEKTLSKQVLDNIDTKLVRDYNITEERIDSVLDDQQVKDLIAAYAIDYSNMFVFGKSPTHLNEDSVEGDIRGLNRLVFFKTGYHFTEKDYTYVRQEMAKGGSLWFLSEKRLKNQLGALPGLTSFLFSVPMMIILIVLDIGLIVLLVIINRRHIRNALFSLGLTWVVFGGFMLITFIVTLVLSFVFDIFLVAALLRGMSIAFAIIGTVTLVVGVVCLLLRAVLQKKERQAPAAPYR